MILSNHFEQGSDISAQSSVAGSRCILYPKRNGDVKRFMTPDAGTCLHLVSGIST